MSKNESSLVLSLDFTKSSSLANLQVVPVVVQHALTKEVLILAYVNELALQTSLQTHTVTLWSTSRNELWVKGSTSGDKLELKEVRVNCEQNSLLFLAIPQQKGVCHTKDNNGHTRKTCFYRSVQKGGQLQWVLDVT